MSKPHFEQIRASASEARLMSNVSSDVSLSAGFDAFLTFGFDDFDEDELELVFDSASSKGTASFVWH
jgi:hypothetical protein